MKLTPDERLYRDLWLAECSRPVPEWHQTAGEKERAEARNAAVMGGDGFVIRPATCDYWTADMSRPPGSSTAPTVSPRGLATPSKRSD